jgi:hypothetical protein
MSVQGIQGSTGAQGSTGQQGFKGDQGNQGDQGARGFQGDQGRQGSQGDRGSQGFQGLKGDKGDKGDQGDRGFKGDQGDRGFQGFKGDKGDKGDQGDRGFQGFKGDKGDKGDQGDRGFQGFKGDKGDKGDQGATGTANINGTGFVKASGTTISYDNSTYYLASNPNGYITGISFANVSAKPTTIAGYGITDSLVYTTSTYSNPSWITALAWSKITGAPAFITGYTETDTLATVTGRGASTSTAVTFNAAVTFAADKYQNPNSEYAIDLRNSDIIGTNAIYFNDNAESSGEGLNFWRSAGFWDTLRAEAGVLYFAPNRATTSASTGYTVYHSGNLTNLNQLTNGPGYITSASWSGLSSGYRENYDLGFRPPDNSSSYAGFRFGSPGNDANAGYFLIRGGSDNDVYTQNGITLVADLGWLTLAQRTTASRGVRIMTGSSTSTERARFLTDGQIQFVNGAGFTYNGNTIWHAGNLTNLNQLSNGPGYITGESDTLASVTARGATTSTSITTRSASTAAALGGFSVMGAGEFMSTGGLAGYFFENRGGGTVTSSSNWYGWYATSAIVRLFNGSTDILSINGATGATTFSSTIHSTDTTNGIYKSGDRLTIRSESTDNVANFANYGLYLPVLSQTAGLYVESPIEARTGLRMGSGALNGTITVGATTGATADRLVQRDGGGDIYSRYSFAIHFNASCPNNENPSIAAIWTNSGADNYLRKSTPAHLISQLGLITTSNIGSQSVNNSSQLNGLSKVQLWNNSGQNHEAYQSFAAIPNFGVWFMQNSSPSDTPQSASQYYVQTQGLGNQYPYGTGTSGAYALMTAVARDHAVKYTYYRTLENGNWGAWTKAAAGYADTAGSLSSMNISQFTNNSGYVTTSGLSTDTDSEQQAGLRYLNWNEGIRRMNTDPRWNESGYDGDLGCLHIWAFTSGGVPYGRAGIALYNDGAYQYLTTKSGTTGLFSNNSLILTASNISSYALTTGGGTVTGTILSSFDNSWALRINRSSTSTYLGITYATGGNLQWYLGPREDGTHTYRFYNFNTTINAWSIDVNGNCTAYADITAYSDFRVKKDITPITTALNKTLLLKGVSYKRTDVEQNKTKIGFIAQDVKEVLPEVVTYDEGADRYGVSYGNITALLVEAIKEQQTQIESQKIEIEELKDLVKQLINR